MKKQVIVAILILAALAVLILLTQKMAGLAGLIKHLHGR